MQALSRSLSVLRALASGSKTGMRLSDIARLAALDKSTTLRLLESLGEEGLVERLEGSKLFRLGTELVFLGWAASRNFEIKDIARPSLEYLADTTEDTAYLTVRSGYESICADRILGEYPIKVTTIEVGNRRPLGVGAGSLAILAGLPDSEVADIINQNNKALLGYAGLSGKQLCSDAVTARANGYAFTKSHLVQDVWAVGRWVKDPRGNSVAAVSIAAVSARFSNGRIDYLASAVEMAARQIEESLVATLQRNSQSALSNNELVAEDSGASTVAN